jgi:starvation-inducible DNA-binding protein
MTQATPTQALHAHSDAALRTPSDLGSAAARDISAALNGLLADAFALYLKTKTSTGMSAARISVTTTCCWMSRAISYAMTDPLAERVRKVGGTTLRSIGDIARQQRIKDNDAVYVTPEDMLAELRETTQPWRQAAEAHGVCEEYRDIAAASLIEN